MKSVLSLGPKFALEPKSSSAERLTFVHQISRIVPEQEADRCVSAGVDTLVRCKWQPSRLPVNRVKSYLEKHSLCLLSADKEGGFAVFPSGMFNEKACEALSSAFNCHPTVNILKKKAEAKKLCKKLDLGSVLKRIMDCKKDFLHVFFNAKTHKTDVPFRVIVSENGTWQNRLPCAYKKN